jgi:endonuclease/exonuclease/phosphatase family metal-dependent hydrolase
MGHVLRAGCALIVFVCVGCGHVPLVHKADGPTMSSHAKTGDARVTPVAAAIAPGDLRVMSVNVRVKTLFDGPNFWQFRKGFLASRIRAFDPDLLGTQECLADQTDYLRDQLPGYEFFGVGRNDGDRRGEMCGVFFKSAKFEKLDGGHFWLSKSPTTPGSKGWGAWFPRLVTWVKLRPRDGGQTFYWFNTHFDAFASRARLESAKLLRRQMASLAGGAPAVVTGDFNADEGSDAYTTLVSGKGLASIGPRLIDTFRTAHPTQTRGDGTRHGFAGGRGGPRIDWIMATPAFQTVAAGIDRSAAAFRRFPSDHFPVTAVLRPIAQPRLANLSATAE